MAGITALNLDRTVVLGALAGIGDRSNSKILANYMQLCLKNWGGFKMDLVDRTNPSQTRPLIAKVNYQQLTD
ncbi:hypothetical protein [Microcoleus sp. bin38.metabat.b11b12b14.051]|uniref:hypothetical protein n=1 Tax=Microcoleus sp. bin38.metabat.b11b12b14.051 TaxID=2742709 RepID=UPI0025F643E0|nr:hypothetical protein [Microcoleus sp. bin38.metabat.b11b12b14.051]